ncbi:MAG: DegQ family serine endoprotease [Gammaproteobacteria bacterium]|nr:DegQ family serine endoprotease [Gammaproteobacteria bacterium]
MKKKLLNFVLAIFLLSINTSYAALPLQLFSHNSDQAMPSLAPMLEQTTPAIVNISTRGKVLVKDNPLLQDPFFRRFFNLPERYREKQTQALGSGVVVDADKGYIITNNHVIDKADEITVTLRDDRKLNAKLIGRDPDTDIAVIQVDPKNLTAVKLANSDQLRVGDFVVAVGNPFGLGQTVTSGIVSALGRSGLGIEGYEDFIQTDASINPGNSGGALVNLRGELVGINTAILSPNGSGNVGIGFAIPVNLVKDIMEQLVAHGEVKRGRLGVYIQDLTADLARAFNMKQKQGAVISQVMDNSPAEKAGLKAGDVVTSVNGRAVNNTSDLRNYIGLMRVGKKVDLDVVRNGRHLALSAMITEQEQKKQAGETVSPRLAGSELAIIEQDVNYADRKEGIQVVKVQRNSPAWNTGLRKGDVIVSVNRILVRDFEELKLAIRQSRRSLLLNIRRGDEGLFLLVQ